MSAKAFVVEIDLKATVHILAHSEEQAGAEALVIANAVKDGAASAGLSMEVRGVKPRQLLTRNEVP